MLVAIIALYLHAPARTATSLELTQHAARQSPRDFQIWVFLAFAAAFAIKVPMFPFHTWLPDAHVEAPTAGSIILAGVLLKMGAYGFIRFAMPIAPAGAATFAPMMVGLSVIAIIYGALVSLVQPDLKKLIAYSSVSHMGFVTLGLFTGIWLERARLRAATQGIDGAMVVMLCHGLLTGGALPLRGRDLQPAAQRADRRYGRAGEADAALSPLFMIMMLGSVGLPRLERLHRRVPGRCWARSAPTGSSARSPRW